MNEKLVLLRGKITAYQSTLLKADFSFAKGLQEGSSDVSGSSGLVGGAAALGLGAAAMATAVNSSARLEEADRVSFRLNGEHVEGWLWRSPFSNGDEVQVVAAKVDTHWEALAVARPSDRIVSLYPHLSRGRKAHVKQAAILWAQAMLFLSILGIIFFSVIAFTNLDREAVRLSFLKQVACFGLPLTWLIFLLPGLHLTWRWMHFVRIAEDVFRTFGWQDVERIDLRKSSRNSKGPDVFGYGALYYKY